LIERSQTGNFTNIAGEWEGEDDKRMVERKGDGIASFTGKMMHSGTEILSVEPQRGAEESKFSGMYGQSPPSLILYSLREKISDQRSRIGERNTF